MNARTDDAGRRLCTATTRKGQPCRGPAIQGGMVCRMHGGAAPQVKEAARLVLLNDLVSPALLRLADLIEDHDTPPAVVLGAINLILARTAYGEPITGYVLEAAMQEEIDRRKAEMTPEEIAAADARHAVGQAAVAEYDASERARRQESRPRRRRLRVLDE